MIWRPRQDEEECVQQLGIRAYNYYCPHTIFSGNDSRLIRTPPSLRTYYDLISRIKHENTTILFRHRYKIVSDV